MAKQKGKSIRWIVVASMILVAYVGWGCMASSYVSQHLDPTEMVDEPPTVRRSRGLGIALMVAALVNFVSSSVTQIPKLFSVLNWHLNHRIWLPVLFVVMECGVAVGGYALYRLEQHLTGGSKRSPDALPPDDPRVTGRKRKKKKRTSAGRKPRQR